MSQQAKYGILALVVIFVAAMVWLLGRGTSPVLGSGQVTYTSSNWEDKYGWSSQDPYGTAIINELITEKIKAKKAFSVSDNVMFDSLVKDPEEKSFLFLGEQFGIYDNELSSLLTAIKNGSDAFIISANVTANILDSILPNTTFRCDYTDELVVKKGKEDYSMRYLFQNDTLAYAWKFLINTPALGDSISVHSTIQGRPNFIELKLGKGSIYLHTNPACFFNYQLIRKDGASYVKHLISQIDATKNIYYLEFGRLDENIDLIEEPLEDQGKKDDSYLQFLFQSPSLIAALLLTMFGLFLFLVFRAKRMRPQVDVIKQKRNMSKVFVETVSSIYRNRENPAAILHLHKKNFFTTVQKHFFIDLTKNKDKIDLEHLSSRTGIELAEIELLMAKLDLGDDAKISDDYLIEAIRLKQDFYTRAGIITDKIQQRINEQEIVLYRLMFLSFAIIMIGVSMILIGLYLLVLSKGTGILLWPIGTVVLAWGIIRMTRPLLKIHKEKFIYIPLYGKKQVILFEETRRILRHKNMYEIIGSDDKKIILPITELSKLDKNKLELFLQKQKFVEL